MPPEPPYKFVSSLPKRAPPPRKILATRLQYYICERFFISSKRNSCYMALHSQLNPQHSFPPPKILIRSRRFSFRKQMLKRARFCLAKDLLNSKLRQRISLCLSNQLVWVTRSHTQQDNTGNKVTQATG